METITGNQISTGVIRITETFMLVCVIAHWTASIFYYIGRLENEAVDLETDPCNERGDCSWILNHFGTAEPVGEGESNANRYLISFYWALYTISTTGYGNITLVKENEKLFAMVAMIVGAILCDAGITAILTALIENKDHQAGSNNRRIDCAKKYVATWAFEHPAGATTWTYTHLQSFWRCLDFWPPDKIARNYAETSPYGAVRLETGRGEAKRNEMRL